jgi:hypothetical protein
MFLIDFAAAQPQIAAIITVLTIGVPAAFSHYRKLKKYEIEHIYTR